MAGSMKLQQMKKPAKLDSELNYFVNMVIEISDSRNGQYMYNAIAKDFIFKKKNNNSEEVTELYNVRTANYGREREWKYGLQNKLHEDKKDWK